MYIIYTCKCINLSVIHVVPLYRCHLVIGEHASTKSS